MTEDQKHWLSEWMSNITALLCYQNAIPVEQKRSLLDDLRRFKESIGTTTDREDTETT